MHFIVGNLKSSQLKFSLKLSLYTNRATFIIPCLNSEQTLNLCLEHIQALERESTEIDVIVVDNGSRDKTKEIATKFGSKVLENKGSIASSRNLGASHAKPGILAFIDSDCLLPKTWLGKAKNFLSKSDVGLVGCKYYYLPSNSNWVSKAWNTHLLRVANDPNPLWLPSVAFACRKEVFDEVGGFNQGLVTAEDVDFGHRISKSYRLVSDINLAPIHLEDPINLKAFFKKEIWRGVDSVKTSFRLIRKKSSIKEFISIALPFCFFLAWVFVFYSFFLNHSIFIFLSLLVLLSPAMFLALDTALRTKHFNQILPLFVVYFVYSQSRMLALIIEAVNLK